MKIIVDWPEELTKGRLAEIAGSGSWDECTEALFQLATIAPEAPKKVLMNLWKWCGLDLITIKNGDIRAFHENYPCTSPWRKIGGPFEVID